jgi:hypothetical protein
MHFGLFVASMTTTSQGRMESGWQIECRRRSEFDNPGTQTLRHSDHGLNFPFMAKTNNTDTKQSKATTTTTKRKIKQQNVAGRMLNTSNEIITSFHFFLLFPLLFQGNRCPSQNWNQTLALLHLFNFCPSILVNFL